MPLSAQESLIYLMVIAAASDDSISEKELKRMEALIGRMPVFEGFDIGRLPAVASACADMLNGPAGLDGVLDHAIGALPRRLQDTAYAVAVEIAAVDLEVEQEELRFLEMIRDRLDLDRLVTAAIETAARARHRRA